jgi:chromosome segregation ATPase
MRVVVTTWAAGIAVALTMFALDYAAFADMRNTTLTTMVDRIDRIDELFRAAFEVDSSLPLGEDATYAQIDAYSKNVDAYTSRVTDYKLHHDILDASAFWSAGASLKDAEATLEKLLSRLPSLATQAESMVKNYDQARSYRAEARRYELAARSLDGAWDWGVQADLYSTAQVLRQMAAQYDMNANRIISNIGDRRKEIRADINSVRKELADARGNCEAAATRGYSAYLKYKAARFSLRRSIWGDAGRRGTARGRMRGTGR